MNTVSRAVLIGIGNSYRRDDGIGPALVTAIGEHDLPGVFAWARHWGGYRGGSSHSLWKSPISAMALAFP